MYQAYAYEDFWRPRAGPIDDADINAGAMMGAVIMIELILAIGVGSIVGLVFAALSLKRRARVLSFGPVALLFNLIPVIFVIRLYVWGL